jgi:hypothetical protein
MLLLTHYRSRFAGEGKCYGLRNWLVDFARRLITYRNVSQFEENNTGIANLGLVQSLVLGQDVSLWSGNRRKMEIAECHMLIPITVDI